LTHCVWGNPRHCLNTRYLIVVYTFSICEGLDQISLNLEKLGVVEYSDIKEPLAWALREQQVERYVANLRGGAVGPSPSPRSSTDTLTQRLLLGTRVDTSSAGANWLGDRCHDDALTI
jgi:hypothetical protein